MLQFIACNNLRDIGVVASARAAEIYGLQILEDGTQVQVLFFFFIFVQHSSINLLIKQ